MNGKFLPSLFSLLIIILGIRSVAAQAPEFLWVKQPSGLTSLTSEYGRAIAHDGSGNSYVTGYFSGTATVGNVTLTSTGDQDMFLIKYDASGNVLWARNAGSRGSDNGYGVAVDGSGNSYVTGYFSGTATFGNSTLTSTDNLDMFLAKYDASGNVLWARAAGGETNDYGYGVAVDHSGNSYVTGSFSGTAAFGNSTLTSTGSQDMFLAKYDASGNVLWARGAGSVVADYGYGVAVDGSGNSFVTGSFSHIINFGGITVTSTGGEDMFLAKYDSSGNVVWVRRAGSSSNDMGQGVAVDGAGNSYVTGQFSGTVFLGNVTLVSRSGSQDVFLAKYDASGAVLWVRAAGGASNDSGYGVAVDETGNSYVTGQIWGTATFGSISLISNLGSQDMFLAKYDASGNIQWARAFGGTNSDSGHGVAVDGNGNSIVTGFFRGTAGSDNNTLTSAGLPDMFLAKYDPAGTVLLARSVGAVATEDVGYGVAVDGSGNSYVTGYFSGTAAFGNITLNSTNGSQDIFLVKYDPSGNVLWARSAGSEDLDFGYGVAVDGAGNSYITGQFRGTAAFGNITLTSTNFSHDTFLAKYDASGNILWARSSGGSSSDGGNGVAVDGAGNSYVTGIFQGTATFGNLTLTSLGGVDMFLAKYDASGNVAWVRSAGSAGVDYGYEVAVDRNGNSYVTGYFSGTTAFGNVSLTSNGFQDMFLAKYDALGNVVWVRGAGGPNMETGVSVAVDEAGNSYVTGQFNGTAAFGNVTLTSVGGADMYLVKYDASGNVLWARSSGGSNSDFGYGVAVDGAGNSYVTGRFLGTANFGNTTLVSAGGTDLFVAKFNPAGEILWAQAAGGVGNAYSHNLAVDRSGNSYVTGSFQFAATFGSTTLTTTGTEAFLFKLGAGPTGINSGNLSGSLSLSPNPTTGKLLLFLPQVKGKSVLVRLLDAKGQVLWQEVNSSMSGEFICLIDMEGKPTGVYLVQVVTNGETISKRVVKQ